MPSTKEKLPSKNVPLDYFKKNSRLKPTCHRHVETRAASAIAAISAARGGVAGGAGGASPVKMCALHVVVAERGGWAVEVACPGDPPPGRKRNASRKSRNPGGEQGLGFKYCLSILFKPQPGFTLTNFTYLRYRQTQRERPGKASYIVNDTPLSTCGPIGDGSEHTLTLSRAHIIITVQFTVPSRDDRAAHAP